MSIKQNTLIIFTPAFPKDENDTIWLPWLQVLTRSLNKNYPELQIIIFSFQSPATTKIYKWFNNTVIPFNGMNKKKLPRFIMWFNIIRKLAEVKRTHNIIGIFSMWCHECAFIGKRAAKIFSIKHYCWLLGQDARPSNVQYVRRIKPFDTELVASSDFIQHEFYKNYQVKPAHVIPHGVDTSMFGRETNKRDIDVIGVGGLSVIKQFNEFVEIIDLLKKDFPSIKAMLVGDGEEKERLQEMIKELSLENNIEMPGSLTHDDVLQIMQRAKLLLHPSSYEGFGVVCIEALYGGAQVISFCKTFDKKITNWHVVNTTQEMYERSLQLLKSDFLPQHVLVRSIDDTAKDIYHLFSQER